MSRRWLVLIVVLVGGAAGLGLGLTRHGAKPQDLRLYGNLDLRQVSLAFQGSERIAAVVVQEGDRVRKGDILARLDTGRLEPQVAQAQAQVAAQQAVVDRLHAGSRPEEIAQARSNLASAQADALNARRQFERKNSLVTLSAVSRQDFDESGRGYGGRQGRG